MTVNLLDFVKDMGTRGVIESVQAYRNAKREAHEAWRAQFASFGFPAGLNCPASLLYHLESRYSAETVLPLSAEAATALARTFDFKRYSDSVEIPLPDALPPLRVSLEEAIRTRRSRRTFSSSALPMEDLSRLLALSGGTTSQGQIPRRAAPSAGALYPIELYACAFSVADVAPALYHYVPLSHSLERVKPLNGWNDLWPILDSGLEGSTPAVAFVLTARLRRVQAKYGERAYRFVLLEAGHIAQNLLLVATALGLNSVPAGGFFDAGLEFLLGIDGEGEIPAHVVLVGRP